MIEELKKNIENEKRIVSEMLSVENEINSPNPNERNFYMDSYNALKNQLKMINNSIPRLLRNINSLKKLNENSGENKAIDKNVKKGVGENLAKFSYVSPVTKEKRYITINREDKTKFLKELSISEKNLKSASKNVDRKLGIKKVNQFVRISNKFFRNISEKIAPKIGDLKNDLKNANIQILPASYISLALMATSALFILSLLVFVILGVVNPNYFLYIWVPFVFILFSLVGFYVFPALQKGSVKKQIEYELPFATIHMAAISSSDIEPTKIFKIISMSDEYPNVAIEMRKVITQVEIYGYDLVSALKNISSQTNSKDLGELLRGIATNISSGGSLKNYLNKKADNLLLDYKLERQRYSALSETFMDVYISILIAAPLVLMMLFIIMGVSGWGIGIGINALLFITISGVVFINIIFLVVMQIKQPKT